MKSGVVTGNVPSDGGTRFLRARLPAMASIGMIMKKRPNSIASPSVVLYQRGVRAQAGEGRPVVAGRRRVGVEDLRQPVRARVADARRAERRRDRSRSPVNARITSEKISTASIAIWTSNAWIFLPRYSGVRPTIRPAMNTDRMTKTSMPYMPGADAAEDHLAEHACWRAAPARRAA